MTTNVNMSDLAQLARDLLKEKTNGQEFMLSDVHNITRQAYENYPEDPVIRQFAFVIEQLADKHGSMSTINQGEMTKIYNDLVRLSGNSKFRKVLGMLITETKDTSTVKTSTEEFVSMNRIDASDTQLTLDDYIDKDLVNSLDMAFGGSVDESRAFNNKAAEKGKEYVIAELESLGFKPRVDILGGDNHTLVYAAHFDTQKGLVSVAIPIDISSDKLLLPSTFVADGNLEELTADKLNYFIDKKAFSNDFSVPNTNLILKAIGIMTGRVKTASDDEFKADLDRFTDRGEVVQLSAPELFYNKQEEEPQSYIDTTPNVEMPKELAHLSQDFENDLLESVSSFGKDAIRAGKGIVLAELGAAGFKNSQVRFGSESKDSVCYLAAIHTPKGPVEIEVPVEMHADANFNYRPLAPSCFAYDGLIEDFTSAKLQRFALNLPNPSSGQVVYSTEHSYMTLPELRDEIIRSASDNDYVACEMILGTIKDRFDEVNYKNAVADYHYLLMLKSQAETQEVRRCSKEIEAGKGSIEVRCGHFGIPMSKVVVGEDGNCQLRSSIERERLNPVKESGAAITTSKLFWS
jgi:hypothetical protein